MDTNQKYIPKKKEYHPQIYAYVDDRFPNYIKIGYTERKDVMARIKEQSVNVPHFSFKLLWSDVAMRNDGTTFLDKEIHKILRESGFKQIRNDLTGHYTEFFECSLDDVKSAYIAVKLRQHLSLQRTNSFEMREEQKEAVEKTLNYFIERIANNEVPHFLWNCKMRFGKTFASYQLMKQMNAKKVLILTFKPAVESQWKEDLLTHVDFAEYQFSSKNTTPIEEIDDSKPFVCFGSLQDYLGKSVTGGIKPTNEKVFNTVWDLIILDEYHYGAWNERTQKMVDTRNLSEIEKADLQELDNFDVESSTKQDNELAKEWNENTLKAISYLYLSGTPFRALASGDFMEDQIYNWTYSDEQSKKNEFIKNKIKPNPYLELPEIIFMTYQMPSSLTEIIDNYGADEFSLSEFFKATGSGSEAKFVHQDCVQKFLDILRNKISIKDSEDPRAETPPLPFSDVDLQNICNHQMWLLPSISACDAMENLLKMSQNDIYHRRKIINASGNSVGNGVQALVPVIEAMGDNPYSNNSGTITLTCGKLTTGVTIRPLTAIFMLSNCSAPETYFQTAFRVQSPWTTTDDLGRKVILKEKCYIFDFAPNRALSLVVDYAIKLDPSSRSAIDKVADFIDFLPVLQYDGCTMKPVDAREIVEFVDNGTTSTLLARRWQSNDLFDISNMVLERILADEACLRAIENIEGWRTTFGNENVIEILVNKNKKIKKLKEKGASATKQDKKVLDEETKERNDRRKKILDKLRQFIRRIPVFMYLSEYREECLNDVITKLEPELFKKTTGLTVEDFETLKRAGLFSTDKLDLAVLYFKRYEDSSLIYTGIDKHSGDRNVGLFNTVITKEEYKNFK